MSDKNYISLYESSNGQVVNYDILDPSRDLAFMSIPPAGIGSDTLKITADETKGLHPENITVRGKKIVGMNEDCCDEQKGRNNDVRFDDWYSGGQYVCTIKGGTQGARRGGCIIKHGSVTDVDIGNYSDQDNNPTTGTRLNFTTKDGSAVKVRVNNGDDPIIENPTQRYEIKNNRFLYSIYRFFKDLLKKFNL